MPSILRLYQKINLIAKQNKDMRICVVDPCGSETGDITGKIEVYQIDNNLEQKFHECNNTVEFYRNYLKNMKPEEVRSKDLDSIIVV